MFLRVDSPSSSHPSHIRHHLLMAVLQLSIPTVSQIFMKHAKSSTSRTPEVSDGRSARSLNRIVRFFSFLCHGHFTIGIQPNADKLINTYCKIGATFDVLRESTPVTLKVNRTKSIFFYLLPQNIFQNQI